jgi:signal transduction histidine kinase
MWTNAMRNGLRATARAVALCGLALTGLLPLALTLAPVALAALGVEVLFLDGSASGGRRVLLAVLAIGAGMAAARFALPAVLAEVRKLTSLTRRLAGSWCGVSIPAPYRPAPSSRLPYRRRMAWLLSDPATWRDLTWLAVNGVAGWIVAALSPFLFLFGLFGFLLPAFDQSMARPAFPGNSGLTMILIGAGMMAFAVWTAPAVLRGYGGLAQWLLGPNGDAELRQRVRYLAETRAETVDTSAAELRRIERDLHDGAQARLVAMGLALDAAGRAVEADPVAARTLILEARDSSARALAELRDLVRGIHPPVLADRGLTEAVRAIALDSPLPVRVVSEVPGRPPAPVESAAYFGVCELLANVAKHSGARWAEVDLRYDHGMLRVGVADNGHGGANPAPGSGLHGIERRLAAFDGVLAVSSPPGGPTVVTLEVPCELS